MINIKYIIQTKDKKDIIQYLLSNIPQNRYAGQSKKNSNIMIIWIKLFSIDKTFSLLIIVLAILSNELVENFLL